MVPASYYLILSAILFVLGAAGMLIRRNVLVMLMSVSYIESDRYYPGHQTPQDIEVPTLSPVECRGVGTWSTMGYYSVESGANVFATGTMNWTRSLSGPAAKKGITGSSSDFTRAVTANLLEGMASGSLPTAKRNVPDLPDYNTSGAA